MTYRFIIDDQPFRTIPAVIIDSRAETPIANQIGAVIKAYTDSQVALVTDSVIAYKIETGTGSIAGYFTLQVILGNQTAQLQQFVLRPAFKQFLSEISAQIDTFITELQWKPDFLF